MSGLFVPDTEGSHEYGCKADSGHLYMPRDAGYSFLQGPSTCMVRPHPAVWRIIHGVVIMYMLALVFLLFQNADDARLLLKVWP